MTTPPQKYRPTDAFRERLEQEVLHRVRHAEPSRVHALPRPTRWAKVAAIVIASASVGATAGFASAQIRQGGERDSLLASARAEAMLAKIRVDLARAQADDVSLKVRVGASDQQSLDAATAELRDMEARRNRGALDIEEITASGLQPRDDLTAPLVGSRDYVKMRIEVDLTAVQARLKAAEGRQAIAERMARVGAGPDVPATVAVDVASAKSEMSLLAEKLKLRAEFLDRGTSADRARNPAGDGAGPSGRVYGASGVTGGARAARRHPEAEVGRHGGRSRAVACRSSRSKNASSRYSDSRFGFAQRNKDTVARAGNAIRRYGPRSRARQCIPKRTSPTRALSGFRVRDLTPAVHDRAGERTVFVLWTVLDHELTEHEGDLVPRDQIDTRHGKRSVLRHEHGLERHLVVFLLLSAGLARREHRGRSMLSRCTHQREVRGGAAHARRDHQRVELDFAGTGAGGRRADARGVGLAPTERFDVDLASVLAVRRLAFDGIELQKEVSHSMVQSPALRTTSCLVVRNQIDNSFTMSAP